MLLWSGACGPVLVAGLRPGAQFLTNIVNYSSVVHRNGLGRRVTTVASIMTTGVRNCLLQLATSP